MGAGKGCARPCEAMLRVLDCILSQEEKPFVLCRTVIWCTL